MVAGRKAKMPVAQLYLLITSLAILSIIVSGQYYLPQRDECGTLNRDYFYNQKRITGLGEFPWIGRVLYINKTDNTMWYQCYSVLINKWFVLLNAYCLYHTSNEPVNVLLGDWDHGNHRLKSDCDDSGRCAPVPKLYKIDEIIPYRNCSCKNRKKSIALVRLNEPVMYSDFIRPICLPSKDRVQMDFNNQLLEVTGWLNFKSNETIPAKSFARVVKLNTCELRLRNEYQIDMGKNICALTCWDDNIYFSGSVLMDTIVVGEEPENYYLIGLTLYAQDKCDLRIPHVYNRVDRYLDWIYEITNKEALLVKPRK